MDIRLGFYLDRQNTLLCLHDEVYLATDPILKGSEIRPGRNCLKKTLDDIKEGN